MTKERLIEAVNAFNPDTGLRDLITSAKATIEYCNERNFQRIPTCERRPGLLCWGVAYNCVLAEAWRDGHGIAVIGRKSVILGRDRKNHDFEDVVEWFDTYNSDLEAAQEVLILLGVEEND